MPQDIQIGADVAEDLRGRFATYAASLGISESALLHLLIRRELRLKRLETLRLSKPVKKATPRVRITAHKTSRELRGEFQDHARSIGVDVGVAVASLAEAELREKWLSTT